MSDTVLMFVYGTLRPGQYNANRFGDSYEVVATEAITNGRMYDYGYPLVDITETGEIVGDVLRVDPNSEWYYGVCRMEMGAQYVPAVVDVTLRDGEVWQALVWHMPDARRKGHGRILDGDYLAHVRA